MKRFALLLMITLALVAQMALAVPAYAQDDDNSDKGSDVDTIVINKIIIQMLSAQKNEQSSNSPAKK